LDPNGDFKRLLTQFPALEANYQEVKPGEFRLKK